MFHDPKSFVEPSKRISFERYEKVAIMSHSDRMATIPVIEDEIQKLLDYIVNLKKVEDIKLTSYGFYPSPAINSSGKMGQDPIRTLPEFEDRSVSSSYLSVLDFMDNTTTADNDLNVYGIQDLNITSGQTLLKIRNEDRFLRRINFKILKAKLTATKKLELLKKLKSEKAKFGEGS